MAEDYTAWIIRGGVVLMWYHIHLRTIILLTALSSDVMGQNDNAAKEYNEYIFNELVNQTVKVKDAHGYPNELFIQEYGVQPILSSSLANYDKQWDIFKNCIHTVLNHIKYYNILNNDRNDIVNNCKVYINNITDSKYKIDVSRFTYRVIPDEWTLIISSKSGDIPSNIEYIIINNTHGYGQYNVNIMKYGPLYNSDDKVFVSQSTKCILMSGCENLMNMERLIINLVVICGMKVNNNEPFSTKNKAESTNADTEVNIRCLTNGVPWISVDYTIPMAWPNTIFTHNVVGSKNIMGVLCHHAICDFMSNVKMGLCNDDKTVIGDIIKLFRYLYSDGYIPCTYYDVVVQAKMAIAINSDYDIDMIMSYLKKPDTIYHANMPHDIKTILRKGQELKH